MKRFAIYARYSSDRQSESSIEDQIRVCRERVAQLGGEVVEAYTDYAISGASIMNRPGIQTMLEHARAGKFDAVLAEALDRLSRDQEDVAALYKRMRHLDLSIVTLSEGEVNELHVGLKGTMNALFLKDLAAKTKRGQRGRVEAGAIPGGLSYGYRKVVKLDARGEPIRGLREIDEAEAAIVRRIFEEFATGRSPRHIAGALNAEGIPSPRGGKWNASTINGNKARKNGILHNELYCGVITYNRQSFRKDPDTAKRNARLNAESEWVRTEVPELRIITPELWAKVHQIKDALAPQQTHMRRRAKRLLSGLVVCGCCGGSYTVTGAERFGCSTHRESGTCTNGRTIAVGKLERRVFDGLREHLLAPELVAEFIRVFHEKWKKRKTEMDKRRFGAEKELGEIRWKITRIVDAIAEGTDSPTMRQKLNELERRRVQLEAGLKEIDDPVVVEMHPNLAGLYARKVAALQEALNEPERRHVAVQILRSMIEKIVLHPGPNRGELDIELHGELAAILALGNEDETASVDVMKMVVAGAGFEPATFRL